MNPIIESKTWFSRGQYVEFVGRKIFTIDEGEAEKGVVLLIHGFPTASWDWCKIWPQLTQCYRCIALDLFGFGFSDKPKNHSYSIAEQADIVEFVIASKGMDQFHVLSHDYGDTVAQELLARQNDKVGQGNWLSLCLLNGGLFPETHRALLTQQLLLTPLGAIVSRFTNKSLFIKSFSSTFAENSQPTAQELDTFWDLITFNDGARNFHRLIRYIEERKRLRERWVGALSQTELPIALINGSDDPISGSHMVDRYIQVVGEPAYLARLEGVGHYPQMEAPAKVVSHFLASVQ